MTIPMLKKSLISVEVQKYLIINSGQRAEGNGETVPGKIVNVAKTARDAVRWDMPWKLQSGGSTWL